MVEFIIFSSLRKEGRTEGQKDGWEGRMTEGSKERKGRRKKGIEGGREGRKAGMEGRKERKERRKR